MGTSSNAADRRWQFESSDGDAATAALIARLRQQLAGREEIATIGRMTAGIAQELNTPLATLVGSLALMTNLAGRAQSLPAQDDIEKLRAELRGCAAVVDRVKDLVGAIRGISHRDYRVAVFFDPARAI